MKDKEMCGGGLMMSRDWLGDIIKKHGDSNETLKGHGKPISKEVLEGNVLDRTIKNANYLPEWIALQHQIRDQLINLIKLRTTNSKDLAAELNLINEKIKKYNRMCPAPMQKMLISLDIMEKQLNQWQ